MNELLRDILNRCEKTGSWYGTQIKGLSQKNDLGDTPLHTICSWGEVESVNVLIESGAEVNARGDKGSTPIFNAVIGSNPYVINALIQAGADLTIKNDLGWDVLSYAKNIAAPKKVLEALR